MRLLIHLVLLLRSQLQGSFLLRLTMALLPDLLWQFCATLLSVASGAPGWIMHDAICLGVLLVSRLHQLISLDATVLAQLAAIEATAALFAAVNGTLILSTSFVFTLQGETLLVPLLLLVSVLSTSPINPNGALRLSTASPPAVEARYGQRPCVPCAASGLAAAQSEQAGTSSSKEEPMVRFLNRCGSGSRRSLKVLAPVAAALLVMASSAQAELIAPFAGSGTSAPSNAMPPGSRWSGMQMGQRSADGHFIVMMIPHHEGAIAIAELGLQRSRRPEIRALAKRIRTSQSQENAQMRRWYRQWYGSDVPTWPGQGMAGMGMGMPGFGTSLEALHTAPDFDRAFLDQMISHHRMGVMMASHAQWGTIHPELRELEAAMVRVQSEEIEQMAQWYRQWFGSANR